MTITVVFGAGYEKASLVGFLDSGPACPVSFCWIMSTAMSAGLIPNWTDLEDSSQEYAGIQSSVKGLVDAVYRQPLLVS